MLDFGDYVRDMSDKVIVALAQGIHYHLCEHNADVDGNPFPCAYGWEKCRNPDPKDTPQAVPQIEPQYPAQQSVEAPSSSGRRQLQIEAPPQHSESSRRAGGGYTSRIKEADPGAQAQIDRILYGSQQRQDSNRASSESRSSARPSERSNWNASPPTGGNHGLRPSTHRTRRNEVTSREANFEDPIDYSDEELSNDPPNTRHELGRHGARPSAHGSRGARHFGIPNSGTRSNRVPTCDVGSEELIKYSDDDSAKELWRTTSL